MRTWFEGARFRDIRFKINGHGERGVSNAGKIRSTEEAPDAVLADVVLAGLLRFPDQEALARGPERGV
jgi:hypothetical protein